MAGRVRVPTVRNRRLQRGGRLEGRPAAAGRTGTAAPLEATGARTAVRPASAGVLAPRPGEVPVSLDVTEHGRTQAGQSRRSRSTPSRVVNNRREEGSCEVLVVIVIAILVLGVAIGPLLAMRNPAEAD